MTMYSRKTDFEDLIFRVDRWDKSGVRLDCCVAACSNLLIGRGAFDAAVELYPGCYITLRNRGWVIAKHEAARAEPPERR